MTGLLMLALSVQAQEPAERRFERPEVTLSHDFTQVRGLRELADGRVLISDRLDERVVVADFTRGTVTAVGRKGSGPEEYRMPGGVFFWPGDSSLVFDEGNARFFVVGPDLRIHRAFAAQRAGLIYTLYPRGADQRGRIYFQVPGWAAGPAVRPDSVAVARLDPRTDRIEELTKVRGSTDPPGKIRYGLPYVPFSPEDTWQVAPGGNLVVVRSGDYHVEWIAANGTHRGPAIPWHHEAVTRQDRIAYTRNFLENSSMGGRATAGGTPSGLSPTPAEWLTDSAVTELANMNAFAETLPPFSDRVPRLSPEGVLWVERAGHTGEPARFDLFDETGRRVGRAVIPAGRRLAGLGRGTLYLVATDDTGIERIECYRR